jgi:hypothetical protein
MLKRDGGASMPKLKNKKTTITGILLLVAAVAGGVAQMLSGTGDLNLIVANIMAALTGAGFLAAGDGSL